MSGIRRVIALPPALAAGIDPLALVEDLQLDFPMRVIRRGRRRRCRYKQATGDRQVVSPMPLGAFVIQVAVVTDEAKNRR